MSNETSSVFILKSPSLHIYKGLVTIPTTFKSIVVGPIENGTISPTFMLRMVFDPCSTTTSVNCVGKLPSINCKVLILRMRSVPAIDATGFHALERIYDRCQKDGVQLILSHVQKHVLKTLEKYDFVRKIGEDHICKNIDVSLMRAESIVSGRKHFLE